MDLMELVQAVELVDVRPIETAARLKVDPEAGLDDWTLGEFAPALQMQAHPVSWGQRLEAWFRMSLDTNQVVLVAAVAVVYERFTEESIPNEVRREFLERLAAMTAVPYLRAEVQGLAAKMQIGDIVLPIVRQGDISFDPVVLEDRPEVP